MGERRTSVNKKNWSRTPAGRGNFVSSLQHRAKKTNKIEVTCVKCKFTKHMTQKMWNRHQKLVHKIDNEIQIGNAPQLTLT